MEVGYKNTHVKVVVFYVVVQAENPYIEKGERILRI